MIQGLKSRFALIFGVFVVAVPAQVAEGQVVRTSRGGELTVWYPQSGVRIWYERGRNAWRSTYPYVRYEQTYDKLIEVDGQQTIVRGAGSRDSGNYTVLDTFPSSYLSWSPIGLRGSWDVWGRWRGGLPYGTPYWGWYYRGTYQGGVIIGERQHLDDLQERLPSYEAPVDGYSPSVSAELLSTEAYALSLMREGRYEQALEALRQFGQRPGDDLRALPDWRVRGMALAGSGRYADAAERMLTEYMLQPWLASRPLDVEDMATSKRVFRSILTGAVDAAHEDASAAGWLLVGVLMQAEGRDDTAWKMIRRAEEAGLDDAIVDEFETALSPRSAG